MNNIIPSFIVITDDPDWLLDNIQDFRDINTLIEKSGENEDRVILTPRSAQVLNLTHQVRDERLVIELVDIDRRFEERFLTPRFTTWMAGTPSKSDIELKEIRNSLLDSNLYVIYGTGTQAPYFAGPLATTLAAYNIQDDSSGKVVTIELLPTTSYQNVPYSFYGNIFDSSDPYAIEIEATSRVIPIKFLTYDFDAIRREIIPEISQVLRRLSPINTPSSPVPIVFERDSVRRQRLSREYQNQVQQYAETFADTIFSPDSLFIHNPAKTCIEEFLEAAFGTKNVMVFLKDIERTHKYVIDNAIGSVIVDKIRQTKKIVNEFLTDRTTSRFTATGKTYTAVRKVVEGLGFDVVKVGATTQRALDDLSTSEYEKNLEGYTKNFKDPEYLREQEFEIALRLKAKRGASKNYSKFENGFEDIKQVIENLMRKLAESSSKDIIQKPQFYFETNLNIINLWHSLGVVPEKDKPVVMLVDEDIREFFLYPALSKSVDTLTSVGVEDFLETIPINPLDAIRWGPLLNSQYVLSYFDITHKNFASTYADPDSFNTIEKLANKFDYPVFRSNVSNPNILEFSVNFNGLALEPLRAAREVRKSFIGHSYEFIQSNLVEEDLFVDLSIGINRFEEFFAKINRDKEFVDGISDSEIINSYNKASREELFKREISKSLSLYGLTPTGRAKFEGSKRIDLIDVLYRLTVESERNPNYKLLVKEDVQLSSDNVLLDMFRRALNKPGGYEVNIKTLPFFGLDSNSYLTKPCLLLVEQINFQNQTLDRIPNSVLSRYLSGFYQIYDIKHNISETEYSSEFKLVRLPDSFSEELSQYAEAD